MQSSILRHKNALLEFAASPKPWEGALVHLADLEHLLQLNITSDLLTGQVMTLAAHKFNLEDVLPCKNV